MVIVVVIVMVIVVVIVMIIVIVIVMVIVIVTVKPRRTNGYKILAGRIWTGTIGERKISQDESGNGRMLCATWT